METADNWIEKVHPNSELPHPKRPPKTLSEGGTNHRQGERASEMERCVGGRTKRPPSVRPSVRPSQKMGGKQSGRRKKEELHPKRKNERANRRTTDERASAPVCGEMRPIVVASASGSIEEGCKQGLSRCGRERCAVKG